MNSTPIKANTKYHNVKCFSSNKFEKSNQPKSDKDCKLGVHTANNEYSNKNYQFYWGYKSLIICDTKSGLPLYEETFTAEKDDISIFIGFLEIANRFSPLDNSTVIADKGFDLKPTMIALI